MRECKRIPPPLFVFRNLDSEHSAPTINQKEPVVERTQRLFGGVQRERERERETDATSGSNLEKKKPQFFQFFFVICSAAATKKGPFGLVIATCSLSN